MLYLFGFIVLFIIEELIRGYLKSTNKSSYLIKSLPGTIVLITVCFLFGPLMLISPIKPGFSSLRAEDAILYYPAGKIDMGKDLLERVKIASADNFAFYKTRSNLPVLAVTTPLDMLRFGAQPQAGGSGSELGIVVKADKASVNVIAHEMSHRNLALITGKSAPAFPRWFDEGLASYLGKMDYYLKPQDLQGLLKDGRYDKGLINWEGLAGMLNWSWATFRGQNVRQLYGQSYLTVKYLFDTYGQDKVYQFVQALKTQEFHQAFNQTFGKSVSDFHQQFINYITEFRGPSLID